MKSGALNLSANKERIKYLVLDIASSVIVWVLFLVYRWLVYDGFIFGYDTVLVPAFSYVTPLFIYPAACLAMHYLSGYYVQPIKRSFSGEFFTTFVTSLIISFGAFFTIILDDMAVSHSRYYYSLYTLFGLQFSISYLFRLTLTLHNYHYLRKGLLTINAVVVGTGGNARKIAQELSSNSYHTTFIGFIDPEIEHTKMNLNNNVLGGISEFRALKEKFAIQSVVVALEKFATDADIYRTIEILYSQNVEIQFTPRLFDLLLGTPKVNNIKQSPLVSITNFSMPDWQVSCKRALDIVISIGSLTLLLPLMIICALRIKTDSKGSIFYRQERIGLHGRPFQILKFRTMYTNAEEGVPQLSSAHDSRITPFGIWLRRHRVDELPQFWNILKGEMSLVGPRPERQFYIDQIAQQAPYYCLLYKIRPGLTSWGPIKIGYSDTIEKMIERLNYDIIYLDNMSLLVDLKILLRTIEVVVKGKGV